MDDLTVAGEFHVDAGEVISSSVTGVIRTQRQTGEGGRVGETNRGPEVQDQSTPRGKSAFFTALLVLVGSHEGNLM